MRTFNIVVNGKTYQVQAEETTGSVAVAAPVAAPVAVAPPAAPIVPAAPAQPAPVVQSQPNAPIASGETIKSPMPGTILAVKVAAGQSVKKHDILLILEAMKMENEIVASRDGIVSQVIVNKGASVNTDDVLIVLQ